MAKRYTDTDKWRKRWFRELPALYMLLWQYLCDNCNHAGIWEVDWDMVEFYFKQKVDRAEAMKCLAKQFIEIDDGKRWLLRDYIAFQCGHDGLRPDCSVHRSIIALLAKCGYRYDNDAHEPVRMETAKSRKPREPKRPSGDPDPAEPDKCGEEDKIIRLWRWCSVRLQSRRKENVAIGAMRVSRVISKQLLAVIRRRLREVDDPRIIRRAILNYYRLMSIPTPTRWWSYTDWGLLEFLRHEKNNVERFSDWANVQHNFIRAAGASPSLSPAPAVHIHLDKAIARLQRDETMRAVEQTIEEIDPDELPQLREWCVKNGLMRQYMEAAQNVHRRRYMPPELANQPKP